MSNADRLAEKADKGTPALEIVSETLLHKHYVSLYSRKIRYDDGRVVDWDVAGHPVPNPAFATVMPFNTSDKTTSLVIEYAQGPNQFKYTFSAGGFDPKKHNDIEETANFELSEEMGLKDGTLVRLIPKDKEGISELKWGRNKFIPFVVIDPTLDPNPRARDEEELMEVIHGVSLERVEEIILNGTMMLPSVQTYFMARKWLQDNSYI